MDHCVNVTVVIDSNPLMADSSIVHKGRIRDTYEAEEGSKRILRVGV